MKKAIIALGLVMVMFFGVSYVYAQDPGDGSSHGWMHGEKSWGQGKELNLTPEQKARFQELHRKFVVENAELIGGLVAKRLDSSHCGPIEMLIPGAILAKERELRDLQTG